MSPNERKLNYDAVVIGSGQGGTPLSLYLADQGLETAKTGSGKSSGYITI